MYCQVVQSVYPTVSAVRSPDLPAKNPKINKNKFVMLKSSHVNESCKYGHGFNPMRDLHFYN